jgi:hypothetical protein
MGTRAVRGPLACKDSSLHPQHMTWSITTWPGGSDMDCVDAPCWAASSKYTISRVGVVKHAGLAPPMREPLLLQPTWGYWKSIKWAEPKRTPVWASTALNRPTRANTSVPMHPSFIQAVQCPYRMWPLPCSIRAPPHFDPKR